MSDLISKYNAHGALKVPTSLWLILAYGLRHVALILFPPTRIAFESYTELFSGKVFLLSDFLILMVIIASIGRRPEASGNLRLLWRYSFWLVFTAYLIDALITVTQYGQMLTNHSNFHFEILLVNILIDIAAIATLMSSKDIKGVFQSFPQASPIIPNPDSEKLTSDIQNSPTFRTRSNVPDATLVDLPINPGYKFSGYPFPLGDIHDPLIYTRQHLVNNNLSLAEKGLRHLLQQTPQNPIYWHELALVAFAAEKLEQAEAMILRAILFDARNYLFWRNLGEIRRRLGHFNNAIEDANKAIALKPDDVNAYYNLGLALWDAGRNDEAMKAFEAAKQRHPDLQDHAIN